MGAEGKQPHAEINEFLRCPKWVELTVIYDQHLQN